MSIFQAIKQQTKIKNIMEHYGIKFRGTTASCCFHKEKTPSMTISESKQIFRCHGCGVGGDSIFFVARLFGISAIDAAKKINSDLRLHVTDSKPTRKMISQYQIDEARRKIEQQKQNMEDFIFQILWSRHKDLRHKPSEDFYDNLSNLLEMEECKYNGI